ncbi:MAG: hypothetical protein JKX97_07865 [Candidatus Lindowbacteria bacterium]|nr:hypothetical protein [Candidatus Lindowbacteria bacterium]
MSQTTESEVIAWLRRHRDALADFDMNADGVIDDNEISFAAKKVFEWAKAVDDPAREWFVSTSEGSLGPYAWEHLASYKDIPQLVFITLETDDYWLPYKVIQKVSSGASLNDDALPTSHTGSDSIYLSVGEESRGPYPVDQVQGWWKAGKLDTSTFVWNGTSWISPTDFFENSSDSLESFAADLIKNMHKNPGDSKPRLEHSLRVKNIASICPAAHAGIKKGDLLVELDGKPAIEHGLDLEKSKAVSHFYKFHSYSLPGTISFDATGGSIGIEFQVTADAVLRRFNPDDVGDLAILWDEGVWRKLIEYTKPHAKKGLISGGGDGPEVALYGAALYETGEKVEGMKYIEDYLTNYSHLWTSNWVSICDYYLAQEMFRIGKKNQAVSILEAAYRDSQYERIADLFKKFTGRSIDPASGKKGGLFASDYTLATIDPPGKNVNFKETISSLQDTQLLVVCLLATYRGNGPYNAFMEEYINHCCWFGDYLKCLHVITMEPTKRSDRPNWYEAEAAARTGNIQFDILHDTDGRITQAIDPQGSPHIFIVNSLGEILHEGWPSSKNFWDALKMAR